GTFSVPLRRTSIKRDNIFNIISAKPPTQMNSIGVDQDGTDFSYFSSFKFGSSEEEYHLLIDSAASNSWVMGSECINSACEAHNTFGEGDSDTLTITNAPFEIVYGTGSVSGRYAEDTAHFAGFSTPMIFGLASNVSSDFLRYPMDGILALARPDTLTSGDIHPTVIDSLRESNLISNKVFGIHLSRHADGENDGELNFGAPNQDRYDNDLTYIPAITDDRGFWQIALDAAGVDGTMLHLPSRTIILDTGTSFILTPHEDAASLHSLIPFSTSDGETFKIPCRSTQTVHFVLGGRTFNISHLDYVGRSDGLEGDMCYSNIIGRTTFGDAQWLVGDVFFKNVYTIFDYDEARIGLGVK
ncbi:acid protease, partial [Patellaria atrata CBS 101060]